MFCTFFVHDCGVPALAYDVLEPVLHIFCALADLILIVTDILTHHNLCCHWQLMHITWFAAASLNMYSLGSPMEF